MGVSQWDVRGDDVRAGWSARTRRWTLWRGRLYDLATDPFEQNDVAREHPAIVAGLTRELHRIAAAPALDEDAPVEVGDDLERQLRALGYVE